MFKNVASQKLFLQAIDSATGRPKTGDAANLTAYVSANGGTATALGDTSASELSSTNAPGVYQWDLTQAETNADALMFTGKSSTTGIDLVPLLVYTTPPNFTALAIDSAGRASIKTGIQKNVAINKYAFGMTDSTAHNPATGKTVTVTRSIDGGAFSAGTIGSVTELSDGIYYVDLPAADLNGNVIVLKFTASGCDALFITLITAP